MPITCHIGIPLNCPFHNKFNEKNVVTSTKVYAGLITRLLKELATNSACFMLYSLYSSWEGKVVPTLYLALSCNCSPSRIQLTEGLGLPNAVQLRVMLPPSLASTYCGGVSVKVGGAATQTRVVYTFLFYKYLLQINQFNDDMAGTW